MTARLHIDWTRCRAQGSCVELLPGLLDTDPWGYPTTRDGERETPIPDSELAAAEDAVALCPRLALRLTGTQ